MALPEVVLYLVYVEDRPQAFMKGDDITALIEAAKKQWGPLARLRRADGLTKDEYDDLVYVTAQLLADWLLVQMALLQQQFAQGRILRPTGPTLIKQ